MIHSLKFRHIRYVNKKGKFIKVKRKFNSYYELISFLKGNYLDAYYSTSLWLNPQKLGPRIKEKKYEEIFLGKDLVFDIDFKEYDFIKNIDLAKKETIKLIEIGKKRGWKLNYIAFSGSKGFHISYKNIIKKRIPDPYEREEYTKEVMEKIAEKISKEVNIDKGITKDTRRIIRIPGTYNSKTGYKCTILNEMDLKMETKKLLKSIERESILKRFIKNIYRGKDLMTKLRLIHENSFGGWFSPGQPSYVSGISSNAIGKRHVLVLEFPPYYNKETIKKEIEGYPGVFVKTPLFLSFMSYLALDKEELEKIMKKTKSKNLRAFRKYGHVVFKYQVLDENFKDLGGKKEVFETYMKKRPISKEHYNFIKGKKSNILFRILKIHG